MSEARAGESGRERARAGESGREWREWARERRCELRRIHSEIRLYQWQFTAHLAGIDILAARVLVIHEHTLSAQVTRACCTRPSLLAILFPTLAAPMRVAHLVRVLGHLHVIRSGVVLPAHEGAQVLEQGIGILVAARHALLVVLKVEDLHLRSMKEGEV